MCSIIGFLTLKCSPQEAVYLPNTVTLTTCSLGVLLGWKREDLTAKILRFFPYFFSYKDLIFIDINGEKLTHMVQQQRDDSDS